jgi:hypothetical protein
VCERRLPRIEVFLELQPEEASVQLHKQQIITSQRIEHIDKALFTYYLVQQGRDHGALGGDEDRGITRTPSGGVREEGRPDRSEHVGFKTPDITTS